MPRYVIFSILGILPESPNTFSRFVSMNLHIQLALAARTQTLAEIRAVKSKQQAAKHNGTIEHPGSVSFILA